MKISQWVRKNFCSYRKKAILMYSIEFVFFSLVCNDISKRFTRKLAKSVESNCKVQCVNQEISQADFSYF